MWHGITVQEGATIRFLYSKIEDAQYALKGDGGSQLSIIHSTFNRNFVGISNGQSSATGSSIAFDAFMQNTFSCTSPLNKPFSGQSPIPTDYSLTGIYLTRGALEVGQFNSINTFKNMQYGIYAENSTLSVLGCHFENIFEFESGSEFGLGGSGIYCINSTLYLEPKYSPPLNSYFGLSSFKNCEFAGIESSGSDIHIFKSKFSGISTVAVSSERNEAGETVHIEDVTVEMDDELWFVGIFAERPIASGNKSHLIIKNNKINATSTLLEVPNTSIFTGSLFPARDKAEIHDNHIVYQHNNLGARGIILSIGQQDEYLVKENEILFNGDGINGRADGGLDLYRFWQIAFDHQVKHNTVLSAYDNNTYAGIHFEDFANAEVCNNSTDKQEIGFRFFGLCDPTVLSINQIGRHDVGLEIDGSEDGPGMIGKQIRRNNFWSENQSDYFTWAALNHSNPEASFFEMSRSDPDILPPKRNPGGDDWMVFSAGMSDNCGYRSPEQLSEIEEDVAKGITIDPNITEAQIWDLKKSVYYRILRFPSIKSSNPIANTFFSNSVDLSYAQFAQLEYDYLSQTIPDTNDQNTLEQIYQSKVSLLNDMYTIGQRITFGTDSSLLDQSIFNDKKVKLDSIGYYDSLEVSLKNQWHQDRALDLTNLISQNATIQASKPYEISKQEINDITFRFLRDSLLTTSDSNDIQDLAEACPQVHGFAVKEARHFLSLCELEALPTPVCPRSTTQGDEQNIDEKLNGIRVFPNPASIQSQIHFLSQIQIQKIKVFDQAGRQIFEKEYDVPVTRGFVSTTALNQPGLYYLQSYDENDKLVSTAKFSIIE